MTRSYYLYLTEEAWADNWVNGGIVPINPASTYLSDVREGTKTPDETFQRTVAGMPDWVVGGNSGKGPLNMLPGGDLTIEGITIQVGENLIAHVAHGRATCQLEDGLILSLSTRLDGELACRLGKKACVQIRCMACLIEALDEQIGVNCKWGRVKYRDGYARDHFLKSESDSWQHEYRLLWLTNDVQRRMVELPANTARRVFW
jgi:hypothetical protein